MFIWNLVMMGVGMAASGMADHPDYGFGEDIFWVVTHDTALVATRLDPVMTPGEVSTHMHAVMGASNFGPTYDYDHSRASECTTANQKDDMSNYWTPQLYHKNDNGTFSMGGLSFVQTYYFMERSVDKEPVYEFPAGFRMLAGDPKRRTLDLSDPAQDAIRYVCLGVTDLSEKHEFPKEHCPMGVRAQAVFPNCWDGVHAWLEGSKHVAYPAGPYRSGGKCPATHPKRIMTLFYEFVFDDAPVYKEGGRVWSNGDDVGYSFHGDFTNGWPVDFFQKIFDNGRQCSVQFKLDQCPATAEHYVAHNATNDCSYKGVKVVEDIGLNGPIAKLPGNNPSADGYKETATFNSGSPSNAATAVILATDIRMGTVKGDPTHPVPPDAVPQTGLATSGSAQATTSPVVSDPSSSTAYGAVTSTQPAASQATTVMTADPTSAPAGGGLASNSESASSEIAYLSGPDVVVSAATSAGTTNPASVTTATSFPSALESQGGIPPVFAQKGVQHTGCGRGGRSKPRRSAT